MSEAIRYKDVLALPKSELHGILTSNDPDRARKAAKLHAKVTEEGYQRGEFIRPLKLQISGISGSNVDRQVMLDAGYSKEEIAATEAEAVLSLEKK